MGRSGRGRRCAGECPDGDAGALPRPGEGDAQLADACLLTDVAKMTSHIIFQYNVLVIDIDNTTLGLI